MNSAPAKPASRPRKNPPPRGKAASQTNGAGAPAEHAGDEFDPRRDRKRLEAIDVGVYFRQVAEEQGYLKIDKEVLAVFPTSDALNQALRTLIHLAKMLKTLPLNKENPKQQPAEVPKKRAG